LDSKHSQLPAVLLIGVDTPIGLTIMRELGEHGVKVHGVGRTSSALGFSSKFCTSKLIRPLAETPMSTWVKEFAAKSDAKVVMAISENDLVELSTLKETLAPLIVLVPDPKPLSQVLNKRETLLIAEALGIDRPRSFSLEQLVGRNVASTNIVFPLIAKWEDPIEIGPILKKLSIGLVKSEFIWDAFELEKLLNRYRPTNRLPLIQEFCPGYGIGQMFLMHDGKEALFFQHRRIHEMPVSGGVSTCCLAVHESELPELKIKSLALLRALNWQGPAMVEYRLDPATGRAALMEINGRYWGSLPLASRAGAHFAWTAYCKAIELEKPVNNSKESYRSGLRAVYFVPELKRLLTLLFLKSKREWGSVVRDPLKLVFGFVSNWFDRNTVFYIFRSNDILPTFADFFSTMRNALLAFIGRR
jgi:predicted ATP-grasp superfamily ATP-dependent carboligase